MKLNNVYFGNNAYNALNSYLRDSKYSKVFVVCDSNTHQHCLALFASKLPELGDYELIEIEPGEENKNIGTVNSIWLTLTELGADRNSLILNLGGGVLTDMSGFCASTFKRGLRFINIPTTLLSMVDASTGGKTGIDLGNLKNQIGVFSFPEMVVVDKDFLESLDQRQLKSGLAEMFKHGLIADQNHWKRLLSLDELDLDDLEHLIQQSVAIKSHVVDQDPNEKGLRKILNFGHTIGHAIETYYMNTDRMLFHGEAISIGMICEAFLSKRLNGLNSDEFDEICNVLTHYFPKFEIENSEIDAIMDLMKHDKKNSDGKLNFSLLNSIGKCDFDKFIDQKSIRESLFFYINME